MAAKRDSDWTPADFVSWMDRFDFTNEQAAALLGITARMVRGYINGSTSISVMCKRACRDVEETRRANEDHR